MSNMSYCRFENTYQDLLDCCEHLNWDLSESEKSYIDELVKLCDLIVSESEDEK